MKKTKVYILIYLSMMLPVLLSAAPIDKYYVPQQQQQAPSYTVQTGQSSAHHDFKKKVNRLSDTQKKELKDSLEKKRDNAANADMKNYYQGLINILN